jgi:hypothetical protein
MNDVFFHPPSSLKLDATNLEEEWRFWYQKFSLFLQATGSDEKSEATQLAMFLATIGDEALKVYNTFEYTSEAERKKLSVVVKKFKEYCTPRKNVVFERFQFWKITQTPGESIDSFVTSLRLRAKSCEFGDQEESLIRDRIVIGCSDTRLQERLLREAELNLQKTLNICRAAEATKEQVKQLQTGGSAASSMSATAVHVVNNNTTAHYPRKGQSIDCTCCGTRHPPRTCPAYGKVCTACNKPNHFASVCRSGRRGQRRRSQSKRRSYSGRRSVNEVTESDNETFVGALFVNVDTLQEKESSWYKTLSINGTELNCKLDTGAQANVMSHSTFHSLEIPAELRATATVLTAYDNNRIRPLGIASLQVNLKNALHETEFFVVDYNATTLLGLPSCMKLDVVRRVDTVARQPEQRREEGLLAEYSDVFGGLGCFPGEHHIVVDKNVRPVIHAPRRVPLSLQPKLKAALEAMLKSGTIVKRDEPTDWVSSLLLVEKPNGKIRLCLDPSDLNLAIKREHYVIPTSEDVIARLHGKKIFTVIDMKDAFWQIKLDDYSSRLCTFNTIFGRFSFCRLPFGVTCAPEVLQKRNMEVFGDIAGVHVIFDDLLIAADDEAEHDISLQMVLERARRLNVRFNSDKLQHKVRQVKYVGLLIAADGIRPDPDKVKAVVDMAVPTDIKALQRFLGTVTYLSKFIPNFSSVTEPLRALVKSDIPWAWSESQQSAFEHLKQLVVESPVLRYFDTSKPAVIQTDASSTGIGSCLMQDNQPIAFASRALTDCETRWAQIEKELMAIVFACEKFAHYIYGQVVTVQSDHKPLEAVFKKAISATTPRLQRMLLRLLKYRPRVEYTPGKSMYIADTLSRAYLTGSPTSSERELTADIEVTVHTLLHECPLSNKMLDDIRDATSKDNTMSELRDYIVNGFPSDISVLSSELKAYHKLIADLHEIDGLLVHNAKIIIPSSLRKQMLDIVHEGHLGIEKCKSMARQSMYWPGLAREIEQVVGRCATCNAYRRRQQPETLLPHPVPSRPWEKIGADIFTLGRKDYLLLVDYYSKYPEIVLLQDKTASSVVTSMKSVFARHGIPDVVITDNMPFSSLVMTSFARDWNFQVVTSSPHFAQSNGQAERTVQTIKLLLKKAMDSGNDPYIALLQYRNTPVSDFDKSPAQLLFNRVLKTKLPTLPTCLQSSDAKTRKDLEHRQQRQKVYYDRGTRDLAPLVQGTVVRVRHNNKWLRGIVESQHSAPRSYVVRMENGSALRRNRRDLISTSEPPPSCLTDYDDDVPSSYDE